MFRKVKQLISSAGQEVNAAATAGSLACWSTTELDGHRVDCFDPAGEEKPAGCVLFLHGHGQVMLNDNIVFSDLLRDHNLCAVVPDGKRSWWLNRLCDEFDTKVTPQDWLVDSVMPMIHRRWNLESPRVALLGVSMGGQGALQLSFRDASTFPIVAAISPAVEFSQLYGHGLPLDAMFESAEDARQASVVLNLHPLAWPRYQWFCCDPQDSDWFDGCVRLGMKLSSSGILHERDLETSGGGHTWEYFNRMAPQAIAHIANGLGQL